MTAGPLTRVERLYRERGPVMWRAVFLFAGDREIASDAVAEAFAQALRRGDQIRSLEPWLWRTVFAVAGGILKERGRHRAEFPQGSSELPDRTVELLLVLRKLSPKQRAAVILHYYADYPMRDVAALTGSTPGAVGVHLHRARQKLRTLLEAGDE